MRRRRLARPRRPRRERETQQDRRRDIRLGNDHTAGLEHTSPEPRGLVGEEPVLGPLGLARIQAPDHSKRCVGYYAPLDFAGRLLSAKERDAEGAAALGDVEQDIANRAPALAGSILVEFVEQDEEEGP